MDIETITKHLNAIKRTSLFCGSNERLATRIGVPSIANNNNFEKAGLHIDLVHKQLHTAQ